MIPAAPDKIRWDPDRYLQFGDQRTQPASDLADHVALKSPSRIVDLGCGPGNSTAVIRQRWRGSSITGLDMSPDMIEKARTTDLQATWLVGDIATWRPEDRFDLIFSNAALHWLPDHETLIPRLFELVSAGGALAVEIPSRLTSPAHRIIRDVAGYTRWNDCTDPVLARFSDKSPAFYYDLLQPIARRLDIWMTEYQHALPSQQSIVDWLRATGLNPILKALRNENDRALFESLLLDRYSEVFRSRVDGQILLPLPRIFFIAYR